MIVLLWNTKKVHVLQNMAGVLVAGDGPSVDNIVKESVDNIAKESVHNITSNASAKGGLSLRQSLSSLLCSPCLLPEGRASLTLIITLKTKCCHANLGLITPTLTLMEGSHTASSGST